MPVALPVALPKLILVAPALTLAVAGKYVLIIPLLGVVPSAPDALQICGAELESSSGKVL